ncbi:MAG: LysM peptidoglycan-binding domain-containing protein [Planctomycetota bacterium]|nr:MAG: LysM peptidoglycan-binding domain-containing protein [Planctomycetota bacterium]
MASMNNDGPLRPSSGLRLSRRQFVFAASAVVLTGCGGRSMAAGETSVHVVRDGETLSMVAARYGLDVGQLIHLNRLDSRTLRSGQRLHLPAGARELAQEVASEQPDPAIGRVGESGLVRRHEWNAMDPGSNWDLMNGVRYVTLHHTDEYPGMRGLSDKEVVHNICRYHRQLGWADIGYHYLVGRDGMVYEGRRVDRQGAHSGGTNNRHNLGVSLIGNFERELPNQRQLAATQRLLDAQLRRYHLSRAVVRGHREWAPTICPGDALFAWMQRYRSA